MRSLAGGDTHEIFLQKNIQKFVFMFSCYDGKYVHTKKKDVDNESQNLLKQKAAGNFMIAC